MKKRKAQAMSRTFAFAAAMAVGLAAGAATAEPITATDSSKVLPRSLDSSELTQTLETQR
jgi:hypothetical protein